MADYSKRTFYNSSSERWDFSNKSDLDRHHQRARYQPTRFLSRPTSTTTTSFATKYYHQTSSETLLPLPPRYNPPTGKTSSIQEPGAEIDLRPEYLQRLTHSKGFQPPVHHKQPIQPVRVSNALSDREFPVISSSVMGQQHSSHDEQQQQQNKSAWNGRSPTLTGRQILTRNGIELTNRKLAKDSSTAASTLQGSGYMPRMNWKVVTEKQAEQQYVATKSGDDLSAVDLIQFDRDEEILKVPDSRHVTSVPTSGSSYVSSSTDSNSSNDSDSSLSSDEDETMHVDQPVPEEDKKLLRSMGWSEDSDDEPLSDEELAEARVEVLQRLERARARGLKQLISSGRPIDTWISIISNIKG